MNVLIFGGTVEGRILSEALFEAGINVTISVATEYGKNILSSSKIKVLADRLTERDMSDLLQEGSFEYVIDATHPYAALATQNIQAACQAAGSNYMRLKRPEGISQSGLSYVHDVPTAVEMLVKMLKNSEEKALLTIGSKELKNFTQVNNFAKRLYIRILPSPDSLDKAIKLGFSSSNIICMQGPFSKEMNIATLRMTGAKFLITKDSGEAGGFDNKISAALDLGCGVIVISRPHHEEGYTLKEMMRFFRCS